MDNQDLGEIVIYQGGSGDSAIQVRLEGETVWLTLDQMAELFQRDKSTISRHVKNVFDEGELDEAEVVAKNATTAGDGKTYQVSYFNLDVIISVGYRVKSPQGVQFRRWATGVLREHLIKGFTLDDERLKGHGGGEYWKELLDRIRDICASEKVLYRQVLDLYATSVDYDPASGESVAFFKMVQNKLHYATHGHTAAELIYERADANSPFMGLTTFKGDLPVLSEVRVAKNYLNEDELKVLSRLVSGFFDLAEINAIEHKLMHMSDYVSQLEAVLATGQRPILEGAGRVTHKQAMEKAEREYRRFQAETLAPVEEAYLATVRELDKTAQEHTKKTQK